MDSALIGKIEALTKALEKGLVERQRAVRLCLLTALAGEHSLLIGPPGTAKSELARRLHTVFRDARYFERLLTRFTVPEELFGPLSIKALEEDRYERHIAGYLPDAVVAFIDEVFKANSAILNALLTLLNEREFDNGAGRQRCPLVSLVGATNNVPEDEVSEAFFDRFLLRLPVAAVSATGFGALLKAGPPRQWQPPSADLTLTTSELQELANVAATVKLPETVVALLAELRAYLVAEDLRVAVSDRRWVKIIGLLRVAAATEGRTAVALWDLLLLPWLTAPDDVRQSAVADWLTSRLGVRQAFAPARLTLIVEAFERTLDAEQKANDLDYDEAGRLHFSATDIAGEIGDAKGGAAALRMQYNRRRLYGETHIRARRVQMDDLLARMAAYVQEVTLHQSDLQLYAARSVWLEPALIQRAQDHLATTRAAVTQLAQRAATLQEGFAQLPRLAVDNAKEPEPILHDPLDVA
ncbi:AAA family ATPase [Rhodoferax sp. GW822-FHT02A01]|uniref:AAA family ATPase n=1 Tax=Rhodoferax sp. GW822-FHT02A01 TaxID=3141537 RepID=UPI00315C4FA2